MIKIGDYEKIMSDRNIFNQIVYTPLSEALQLLEKRRKNLELMTKVEKLLKGDIPEFLKKKKCGVLSRQVATPNYESKRFISITKNSGLHPTFFEYHNDRFTPENIFKHSLGQLHMQKKKDKNGNDRIERTTIVDFHPYSGKKLREVKTLWNELLIDFHKKLFTEYNYNISNFDFYDGSNWYKNNGVKPANYYINFFLLFSCFGILFENFLTSKDPEGDFTKNIVLPSIEKTINLVGIKPLIVPLEPINTEADKYWYSYDCKTKNIGELLSVPKTRGVKHKGKNKLAPIAQDVL